MAIAPRVSEEANEKDGDNLFAVEVEGDDVANI
jgi:hypothetical protein